MPGSKIREAAALGRLPAALAKPIEPAELGDGGRRPGRPDSGTIEILRGCRADSSDTRFDGSRAFSRGTQAAGGVGAPVRQRPANPECDEVLLQSVLATLIGNDRTKCAQSGGFAMKARYAAYAPRLTILQTSSDPRIVIGPGKNDRLRTPD